MAIGCSKMCGNTAVSNTGSVSTVAALNDVSLSQSVRPRRQTINWDLRSSGLLRSV